ncbi:MAG: GTPase HflX, partial [Candidatus Wallbacteria bacterium]|nr:GTPase HflX [Candidatus Wallbacteria bacterium]
MSKAVIIRLRLPGENEQDTSLSLDELEALLSTLHIPVKTRTVQARHAPCSRFYFGSGKVDELKELIQDQGADLLAVDNTLSATQQRNISNAIGCEVRDRTAIILEIFSRRARSHEGKLQVEIAQLRYALTMLTGKGKSMSRQAGGIGTRRGIGETQLELDRRRIRDRLAILGKRLHEVTKMRFTQRKVRKESGLPVVSLVGY